MTIYNVPIDDFIFLLHDVLNIDEQDLPGFGDYTVEFTRSVLEAAGTFHEDIVFPLNLSGDAQGARLENGAVRTPDGFRAAYDRYCADGWNRVGVALNQGGMGLPPVISNCVKEIGTATNHAFDMYASGPAFFAPTLAEFGPEWLTEHVVPRLVSGEWTPTMCLTEPACGSDLRLIRTRATRQADGSYRLSGSKIFITSGDHDLAENILHFVLAKIPDAQGRIADELSTIGCFFVPKLAIDPQTGVVGQPNGVTVGSIEKKMGLKASATCVMNFDDAVAWPMSPRDAPGSPLSMAAMFQIMNHARLATAIGAVGIASTAYQSAAAYARERIAGRALGTRVNPDAAADPLIAQPDVRRLLLESASFIEGARATIAWTSLLQSLIADGSDAAARARADDLQTLFTPVLKAYFSDKAYQASNACQQVFGGHGYVHDNGMEQLVRDGRIHQIYEGANGLQAFDLVVRRMTGRNGSRMDSFFAVVDELIADSDGVEAMAPYIDGLRTSTDAVREANAWLGGPGAKDLEAKAAVSYDVLTAFGIAIVAFSWARVARVALFHLEAGRGDSAFLNRKLVLARIWMEREAPLASGLVQRIGYGAASLMELDAQQI